MKPTRAVIPLAGLASRLQPASRVTPKALFPVPGPDGSLRAAVEWIVREAIEAGIEEVLLVVAPRDGDLIRRYFEEPPPADCASPASSRLLNAWRDVSRLGDQLRYVVQPEARGFGDAVLRCYPLVGDRPFLLLLGDHLYRSHTGVSCLRQVLEAGAHIDRGVVGVARRSEVEVGKYGIVAVEPTDDAGIYSLSKFREKPTVQEARAGFRLPGSTPPSYFCMFGIYLLPGTFMSHLAASAAQGGAELDLSRALEAWIRDDGGLALEVQGEFLDIGTPSGFRDTVIRFSASR